MNDANTTCATKTTTTTLNALTGRLTANSTVKMLHTPAWRRRSRRTMAKAGPTRTGGRKRRRGQRHGNRPCHITSSGRSVQGMAYRKRSIGSKKLEAMRKGKEAARLSRPLDPRPPELPDLRRRIVITDFDFGEVTHTIELYRTNRVDCYRAVADGSPWKLRIGWAKVLEMVRKSFIRVGARPS